ncbi:Vms1/Ankzf1 family peptidyl-tRNA hydrolase [Streptomyces iconiensis]|uniref:Vms1/Ankzf1 family peptidyl-tRNA hydrolase n=1 Tax=Streptomyces iconiensis TaxID=1384038 RepID=A0ABT7A6Y9_9ACTN|nr:Vms1/Ankzf1 family peptidyl-tRNA hydrolase [Streptomyces iconiensis]MDJ1137092.1 Vms1/Ankzf1 family peptidyl-tRNA hydrolase [Streptomyces iconiensis]
MHLSSLAPLLTRNGPWATVYSDTPQATESAGTERRLAARGIADELTQQGADVATAEAVAERLEARSPQEEPLGSVVFAAGGEVVLDLPLTDVPERRMVSWSVLPHLAPLPRLTSEDPLCLTVRVDRTGADFQLSDAQGTHAAGRVDGDAWPVHRTSSGEMSERHFQTRVENTWENNAALIAEATVSRFEETGADVLVLCGDTRERRAVHERLPQAIGAVTVETSHGGRAPGSGTELLDLEAERVRTEYAGRHAAETLEAFRAGRAPGHEPEAAEGVPALIEAAREHRVGTLLVDPEGPDAHQEVWVGPDPDQIGVRRSELAYLGAPDPSPARADDALLRNAAATGAEVLVPGPGEDIPVGGLGALLRWTYG